MITSLQEHQQAILDYLKTAYQQQNGLLSFADFMKIALYAPGLGYYSAGLMKFGPEGDFVTAPEISPLFSQCLAHQCMPILQTLPGAAILELGAGTGRMAADLLKTLAKHHCLPEKYFILEVSADLKAQQQRTLQATLPDYFDRIEWLNSLAHFSFAGILLANEVIDALPVHLFKIHNNNEILEGRVILDGDAWTLIYDRPISQGLTEALAQLQSELPLPLSSGYTSEILLSLEPWLNSLAACLTKGVMLFIDYGFPAHEYYHPSRHMGTLMCHTRHRTHADPFQQIGLQDLTSHVDFTALAQAGINADLTLAGFTTQSAFLLANGLLAFAEQNFSNDLKQNIEQSQQIQMLTAPHEMGELFKVMAFSKGVNFELHALRDHRHRL